MKKNTKPTDRKRTITICGLSALCIAVLAGAYFLTREPEREFIPASAELADVTDTWGENSGTDNILPDAAAKESSMVSIRLRRIFLFKVFKGLASFTYLPEIVLPISANSVDFFSFANSSRHDAQFSRCSATNEAVSPLTIFST